MPDETWHEADPEDPLSLIDQVKELSLLTCVSAFVEILHILQCKIFKYTFLGQYPMKC